MFEGWERNGCPKDSKGRELTQLLLAHQLGKGRESANGGEGLVVQYPFAVVESFVERLAEVFDGTIAMARLGKEHGEGIILLSTLACGKGFADELRSSVLEDAGVEG